MRNPGTTLREERCPNERAMDGWLEDAGPYLRLPTTPVAGLKAARKARRRPMSSHPETGTDKPDA